MPTLCSVVPRRASAPRLYSVGDIADAIKSSEDRVLEHVGRVVTLMNVRRGDATHEKARVARIHARLTMVESVVRRLNKS